jgi:uncharacterized protein with NAD-binding domain and iron-sulfur cluster
MIHAITTIIIVCLLELTRYGSSLTPSLYCNQQHHTVSCERVIKQYNVGFGIKPSLSNPTTKTTRIPFIGHKRLKRDTQQQLRSSTTNNDSESDQETTIVDQSTLNTKDKKLSDADNDNQDFESELNQDISINQQQELQKQKKKRTVAIIGAGWAGLSAAYQLSKQNNSNDDIQVVVIEASARVGGLVRDGYTTISGQRPAEAGQHGFWNNYYNIYNFLQNELSTCTDFDMTTALTDYAEQGQYSPTGIQAIWPIYKDQLPILPTGLAQAAYTKFFNLPLTDLISAFPLVIAFSDFDDSPDSWDYYDQISFYDLCIRLGVSKRCYDEAFEPMILTGLFAPGRECSAAAALGMAYFFVLRSQISFDVQWCRGNIGTVIFDPWIQQIQSNNNVQFMCNTRVSGFELDTTSTTTIPKISTIKYKQDDVESTMLVDDIIFAVGGKALNMIVKNSPELSKFSEFRRFANLRGTSVLATRIFLDRKIDIPYSANACWGFDDGVGMTMFDISTLHGPNSTSTVGTTGSVIEVDYYYANTLLCMQDDEIVKKVKRDLDTILGHRCRVSAVIDAAVVRLPDSVNWYFPGSYKDMPDGQANSISNLYFAGDIVRTRHGSWSQEKAYVTGIEAANTVLGLPITNNIIPLPKEEAHVQFGRYIIDSFKQIIKEKTGVNVPSFLNLLL